MSYSISYTPMSDAELLRIANQMVAPSYDEQMALYEKQTNKQEAMYNESLNKLDPTYARLGADVETQYENKRQNVSDAALARGFGRSSYVTDVIGQTHDQQMLALEELSRRKSEEADSISAKIETLYDELLDNQARLSSAKQNKILSTIDQLRMEQNTRQLEVMKYNSDIALRQEQLQMQYEQLQMQQEQFTAQMSYNQQKQAEDNAYRSQQSQFAREQFEYQQYADALAREAAAAAAAAKQQAELIKANAAASKSSGSSKTSGSSSSNKTQTAGFIFTGVRA